MIALLLVACGTDDDDATPSCEEFEMCAGNRPLLCNAMGLCACDPDGAGPEPSITCQREEG